MSAAARARASASSSSGRDWRVGVVGVVYRVRLHGRGSCRRGLAPWVILADGPGGLIYARICPGRLSRRWYANPLRHIGHEGGGCSPGRALHPYIAADLRAPVRGGEREPGAGLPRMQGRCPLVQRRPDTLTRLGRGRPGWPVRRRSGAQSSHIKVRSVFCGRAESVRAQQVAVAGPRIPQGCVGRTIWFAVQVPFENQRGQVGVGGEVADHVIPGDLAAPDRSGVATWSPARRGHWRTTSPSAIALKPRPPERVTLR